MDNTATRRQKLELQQYLQSLYPIVKGEGIQYRTRCIFCGDSKKDPNKMRLGIKVDPDDPDLPVIYHCFNNGCGRSGVLTNRMLKEIAGGQADFITKMNVDSINNAIIDSSGNTKTNRYRITKEIKVTVPTLRKDKNDILKAKYIFERLGTVIDPEELIGLKIIWSLNQFLAINNIKPVGKYTWLLDRDYVGFLSVNNDFIIFRDVTNTHRMKHVKYNIFDVLDNSQCFYSIPGKADMVSPNDIHFKIAEGPFDILSVLYNMENNCRKNNIYLASSNGEFFAPLLHYFQKGFVGSNIFIDIYKDNDSKVNYELLRKRLKIYTTSVRNTRVYYNAYGNEKDFGVPKNRIQTEIFL